MRVVHTLHSSSTQMRHQVVFHTHTLCNTRCFPLSCNLQGSIAYPTWSSNSPPFWTQPPGSRQRGTESRSRWSSPARCPAVVRNKFEPTDSADYTAVLRYLGKDRGASHTKAESIGVPCSNKAGRLLAGTVCTWSSRAPTHLSLVALASSVVRGKKSSGSKLRRKKIYPRAAALPDRGSRVDARNRGAGVRTDRERARDTDNPPPQSGSRDENKEFFSLEALPLLVLLCQPTAAAAAVQRDVGR